MVKQKLTYIQVTKNVAKLLQGLKLVERESYNQVIERLCKEYEENRK